MLLVVEKDPRFTAKLKQHLKVRGLRTFFVESIQDALFLMKSMPAKFLLVNLNGASDLDDLLRFRKYAANQQIPVLYISGFKNTRPLMEALQREGETAIMSLPFGVKALIERIENLRVDRDPFLDARIGPPGQEVLITSKLGQGAMSSVYEGTQLTLERKVAVKVISQDVLRTDQDAGRRFLNEARAMALMRSPHVVQVFSVGSFQDRSYLVMEYIDGPTLEKVLRMRKMLSIREAVNLTIQILDGLSEAHRHGKIHRDLKPANIMINGDQQAVILDFGLVRDDGQAEVLTKAGTVLGTPRYISPEQVTGTSVDSRCDLYSLGVILFEMLIGEPPFKAKDFVGVLMKHAKEPMPKPEKFGKSLPKDLFDIILKMTRKRPEDRYQTTQEVRNELAQFLAGIKESSTLDAHSGSFVLHESMKPSGGVMVDGDGLLVRSFGQTPEGREETLQTISLLVREFQELAVLGEFERGFVSSDNGNLVVFRVSDGMAALETQSQDVQSKIESLSREDLASFFEGVAI